MGVFKAILLFVVNIFWSTDTKQKRSAYNCGMDPKGDAHTKARFRAMNDVMKHLRPEVKVLRDLLTNYNLSSSDRFEAYVFDFLVNKLKGNSVRAFFIMNTYDFLAYEYGELKLSSKLRVKNTQNLIGSLPNPKSAPPFPAKILFYRLAFVYELVITIQYLDNQILDEKYGVGHQQYDNVKKNLLASNILRELTFAYIHKSILPHLIPTKRDKLISSISRLLLTVDRGQITEQEINTYSAWVTGMPYTPDNIAENDTAVNALFAPHLNAVKKQIDKILSHEKNEEVAFKAKQFLDGYFHRIYLTNTYYFQNITETIADMLSISSKSSIFQDIKNFALLYGMSLQIINDYSDYAYSEVKAEANQMRTKAKLAEDRFADLYNFNVTLPLIFHLLKGQNNKIETYLRRHTISKTSAQVQDSNSREEEEQEEEVMVRAQDAVPGKVFINIYGEQIKQEIVQSGAINKTIDLSRKMGRAASKIMRTYRENPAAANFINMCGIAEINKFYRVFYSGSREEE